MEGTPLGGLLNIPALLIIFGGIAGVSFATFGMEGMKLIPRSTRRRSRPSCRTWAGPCAARRLRRAGPQGRPARARGGDRGDRGPVHAQGHAARRRRHRPRAAARDPRRRDRLDGRAPPRRPEDLRERRRLRPDHRRARHRHGPPARHRQPADAGAARPRHLRRVHRDALRRGLGERHLPAHRRALAELTQSEVLDRTLVIEGILAIQAGENPRVVQREAAGLRRRPRIARPPPSRAPRPSRPCPRRRPRSERDGHAARRSITRSIPTSVGW